MKPKMGDKWHLWVPNIKAIHNKQPKALHSIFEFFFIKKIFKQDNHVLWIYVLCIVLTGTKVSCYDKIFLIF